MKRSALILGLGLALLFLMSFAAAADTFSYEGTKVTVRTYEGDGVAGTVVPDDGEARAYVSGGAIHPGGPEFGCNKSPLVIEWATKLQMAQWAFYNFNDTQWNWYVRKPGEYFADCIGGSIRSNGDLRVTFAGFGPLLYEAAGQGVTEEIETWYGYSNEETDMGPFLPTGGVGTDTAGNFASGWYQAPIPDLLIGDSQRLHDKYSFKLWNRIKVVPSNSASNYSNTGTITITLENQKDWIDPETGLYKPTS